MSGDDARFIDATRAEQLLARCAAGDPEAGRTLVAELWPHWLRLARASRALREDDALDDAAHEVATRLAEKLGRASSPEARLYEPWKVRHAGKTFADWMTILVANACRDVGRARRRQVTTEPLVEPSLKGLLNEMQRATEPAALGVRPPVTATQTARELLDYGAERLPRPQWQVLERWLQGHTFEEMADELRLSAADEAQRLLRAAVATLRRHFADAP